MVYFESFGENDFASIFRSVADEKAEAEEIKQTEMFLRLLNEIDSRAPETAMGNTDHEKINEPQIEHYVAIDGDGEIIRGEDYRHMAAKVNRNKVHTIADLPKESEWETLFGPTPEPEPSFKVESGMRIKDGKKVHRAFMVGEPGYFEWQGISFDALLLIVSAAFFILFLLTRYTRNKVRKRQQERLIQSKMDHVIEEKVEKRMKEHFRRYRITARDFC
jgi:hypothetical protein